ncbi:MAG: pyridoxamine 5'-phosphate oxidase family protein [Pseudomonadota bacterium]
MATAPSERTRVRRAPHKARYDKATIRAILDATPLCAVGYAFGGAPYVTPTLHWREGDHVYWHGSSASAALRGAEGAEVCFTVSILDGFVLARSGMHHSVNSRSVTLFGVARKVEDAQKSARLDAFIDGLFPGRAAQLRPATAQELKATTVLGMAIDEASAKIREGGPKDDEEDYSWPVWAGVLPVRMAAGGYEDDDRLLNGAEPPDAAPAFLRKD